MRGPDGELARHALRCACWSKPDGLGTLQVGVLFARLRAEAKRGARARAGAANRDDAVVVVATLEAEA